MRIAAVILLILVLGYTAALLALRCRRHGRGWEKLLGRRYAHRGYHDKPQIPENSLPAFRRALERGWGAELDIHLLRDGTLAVFHDSDLRRCAGVEGTMEDLDLAALSELRLEGTEERVPLFSEVLALFEGKAPLIIELKAHGGNHRALTEAVLRVLEGYRGDYCIESFDPRVLMVLRKTAPTVLRGQLSMDFRQGDEPLPGWQCFFLSNLLLNFLTVPDFIAYRFEDRERWAPRRCVRLWGAREASWTLRSREDLEKAEAAGCLPIFERFDPEEEPSQNK
ncbi:MAG: glycerophosphodiester phosphodiesterase [Oscillospiraceae bacterium]|nr:glycerophosphodiester phosphodiesterase [Oscillospiraceae bacterium]